MGTGAGPQRLLSLQVLIQIGSAGLLSPAGPYYSMVVPRPRVLPRGVYEGLLPISERRCTSHPLVKHGYRPCTALVLIDSSRSV